jgi:hypothetical protein
MRAAAELALNRFGFDISGASAGMPSGSGREGDEPDQE